MVCAFSGKVDNQYKFSPGYLGEATKIGDLESAIESAIPCAFPYMQRPLFMSAPRDRIRVVILGT
jgi:hypothetical protein